MTLILEAPEVRRRSAWWWPAVPLAAVFAWVVTYNVLHLLTPILAWLGGENPNAPLRWVIESMSWNATSGAAAVFAASRVAPWGQRKTAAITGGALLVILGLTVPLSLSMHHWGNAWEAACCGIGAAAATWEELKSAVSWSSEP